MKYNVLTDFADSEHKVAKNAGEVFIPAETNYPDGKTAKLVNDGVLELITPDTASADDDVATKKSRKK